MAEWPANGVTDWNTKSLAYLAVEHNTDGTHDIHDAEGGYNQVDVNGTKTNVYTKYFTGNLDADSTTSVAHGVTASNILAVSVICYDDNTSSYRVSEAFYSEQPTITFYVFYGATNITIEGVGSALQGNAYRIKIDYTV